MTNLIIPTYESKEKLYSEIDPLLSYIAREDVYLAHFKTEYFKEIELQNRIITKYSIRNSDNNLLTYNIPVPKELKFKVATCIFSENRKTLGLKKHIHLPKTHLQTITIGKKIFKGNDDVKFNFYRHNGPQNINLTEDFVLCFDSSRLIHDITVPDNNQSIWLFSVFEFTEPNIDLELIREFYNCKKIYDYQ